MIKKYIKKPVIIEAIQFKDNANCILAIHEFMGQENTRINYEDRTNPYVKIETLEGTMRANVGDYIIKGINGLLFISSPLILDYISIRTNFSYIYIFRHFFVNSCLIS